MKNRDILHHSKILTRREPLENIIDRLRLKTPEILDLSMLYTVYTVYYAPNIPRNVGLIFESCDKSFIIKHSFLPYEMIKHQCEFIYCVGLK